MKIWPQQKPARLIALLVFVIGIGIKSIIYWTVPEYTSSIASASPAINAAQLPFLRQFNSSEVPNTKNTKTDEFIFHSRVNGYSISLPDGWIKVPDDVIQQWQPQAANLNWEAVFQRKNQPWGTYPYLILRVTSYGGQQSNKAEIDQSLQEIADGIKMMSGRDALRVWPGLSGSFSHATLCKGQVDISTKTVWNTLKLETAAGDKLESLFVANMGRHAVVAAMCYTTEADFDAQYSDFVWTTESFHFDSGWGYDDP